MIEREIHTMVELFGFNHRFTLNDLRTLVADAAVLPGEALVYAYDSHGDLKTVTGVRVAHREKQ